MPRIVFIITFMGKYPWYFPYFLHSCRYNPTVDFIIFTDNSDPNLELPPNVKLIPCSLDRIKAEATKALGFEVAINSGYKLCDLRPAYGTVFSDFVRGYDFWGYCDIDVIFQQIYWKEMAELFHGSKIMDICDPDWIHLGIDIVEQGQHVDAVTCSSAEMKVLVQGYFPDKIVEHVPDRFDFSLFPKPHGLHHGKARKAVCFGFTHNAHETLPQLAPAIGKFGLELLIVANAPYSQQDGILALNPRFARYEHYSSRQHVAESETTERQTERNSGRTG